MRAVHLQVGLTVGLALGLPVSTPLNAQDSTQRLPVLAPPTLKRLSVAGGLIAAAVLADHGLRSFVQHNRWQAGDRIASVGNRLGEPRVVIPLIGAAWLAGRIAGDGEIRRTSFDIGKAVALAGAATQIVKFSVGRARPAFSNNDIDLFQPFNRSDQYNSFPSGHTAVAFAAATVLSREVHGKWASRLFYTGATMTGFARINNDKHWLSDVVAGAFLGHFAGVLVTSKRFHIVPAPGGAAIGMTF